MKHHYIYRITNILLRMYYYGVRSTNLNPKDDLGTKYFSSSSNKEFIKDQKENPQNYRYKIIRIFDNRKDAISLEIKLHNKFNVKLHESFYNRANQTVVGFDMTGRIQYRSTKQRVEMSNIKKEQWMNNKEQIVEKIRNTFTKNASENFQHIVIFNSDDELIYYCNENINRFISKNNLPKKIKQTYLHDSILYENLSTWTEKRLINNGNIKYKGWYARLC